MTDILSSDLEVERHDVFDVMQLTRGTPLESQVAADLVEVEHGSESNVHRHNRAETMLYFLDGAADVVVGDDVVKVVKGDRLLIGKGVYHAVRTPDAAVTFLSVQSPPILDKATDHFDLEPLTS